MKKTPEELALEAYLVSITKRKALCSDNKIITNVKNGKVLKENKKFLEDQKRRGKERKNNPEWQRNHAEAMANKGPEFKQRMTDIIHQRVQDPDWLAKNAAANKKRLSKPVIVPWGVFESGVAAGDAYNKMTGTKNGKNHVWHHVKQGTLGYQFITQEEYIMLTGKDI